MNKRNFYLKSLPASERKFVEEASSVDGIDDEIVILRLNFKTMLEESPRNNDEILRTAAMLGKLIKIRYSLSGDYKKGFNNAVKEMNEDYFWPVGLAILPKKPGPGA